MQIRIWAMRHGQSTANVEGVIVSAPGPRAFEAVGLTPLGREQAEESASAAQREHLLGPRTRIITSDFARAHQTARIAARVWGAPEPTVDTRLRERNFGTLDGGPATAYDDVWLADRGHAQLPEGAETAEAVGERVQSLIRELLAAPAETAHAADPNHTEDIVLVAHGDVLQILQAALAGRPAAEHRSLPHLGNAEIRLLHTHEFPALPAQNQPLQHP